MLDSASLHSVPHDALGSRNAKTDKAQERLCENGVGDLHGNCTMIVPIMLGIRCLQKYGP